MLQVKYFYYPIHIKEYLQNRIKETPELNEDRHLDKMLYILHLLYWSKYQYPTYYPSRGVTINTLILKRTISEPKYYTLLKALVHWKLIVKLSDSYQPDKYSKTYKLHKDIEELQVCKNQHQPRRADSWLNKMMKKFVPIEQPANIEEYQLNIISQLTFSPQLNQYVKDNYPGINLADENSLINVPIPKQLIGLFTLLDNDYYSMRRPFNHSRFYSNIVSLKRPFRPFLMLHGKHLQQLDIKNAQIFLGYFFISEYIQTQSEGTITEAEYPEDVLLFKAFGIAGGFYEYLALQVGWNIEEPEEREKFKKEFFKFVWYAELAWYAKNHKLNIAFRKCFPTVAAIIEEIKKPDHKVFPVQLQDLEAKIMLDIVGKELMKRNILFLTIHDAVLVNNDKDCDTAKQVMEDAFKTEFGIVPTIDKKKF